MFDKIISIIISLLVSIQFFNFSFIPKIEKEAVLTENVPSVNQYQKFDKITGVSGTEFYIIRPDENLSVADASKFGLSELNADNTESLENAIEFCRSNPNTVLNIKKGTYYFSPKKPISLSEMRNIKINGNGSTFINDYAGTLFTVDNCDCFEIDNLNIDWNWEKDRLADVVKIENRKKKTNTLDFVFVETDSVDENIKFSSITQCDENSFTFGAKGGAEECYLYMQSDSIISYKKINSNTLRVTHNGCMKNFQNGEYYILRHYTYDGTIFNLYDCSKNITFDNVNIYGSAGMSYVISGNTSHFQILNSMIGVNPEYRSTRHVSNCADAIHIVNTNGCFRVAGCDISGMGDDAINVHDGLGYINSVQDNTAQLTASAMRLNPGDEIGFKDESFKTVVFTAKIVSVKSDGSSKTVIFDKNISNYVKPCFTAFNHECNSGNYVIENNYFHENRARGLLLQSSHGLCRNNKFYKIEGQAIKIVMDIMPSLWQEGTGVSDLEISDNNFDLCDYSRWGSQIEIGTNIDGRKAASHVFNNITVKNNRFSRISENIMLVNNVNGLDIIGNTFIFSKGFNKIGEGKIHFENYCDNISYEDNIIQNGCLKSIIKADKYKNLVEIYSEPSKWF